MAISPLQSCQLCVGVCVGNGQWRKRDIQRGRCLCESMTPEDGNHNRPAGRPRACLSPRASHRTWVHHGPGFTHHEDSPHTTKTPQEPPDPEPPPSGRPELRRCGPREALGPLSLPSGEGSVCASTRPSAKHSGQSLDLISSHDSLTLFST